MNEKICKAIRENKKLKFRYEGLPRTVEPFCHGLSTNNKDTLRAYQTDGKSSSGALPDWRPFTVRKISNLKLIDEEFKGEREGYNPNDSMMMKIYCNI